MPGLFLCVMVCHLNQHIAVTWRSYRAPTRQLMPNQLVKSVGFILDYPLHHEPVVQNGQFRRAPFVELCRTELLAI